MIVTDETKALAKGILDYWRVTESKNQDSWVGNTTDLNVEVKEFNGTKYQVCNSTLCAAGTAVFLTTSASEFKDFVGEAVGDDWEQRGGELLGLNDDEADNLFYSTDAAAPLMLEAIANGDEDAFWAVDKCDDEDDD